MISKRMNRIYAVSMLLFMAIACSNTSEKLSDEMDTEILGESAKEGMLKGQKTGPAQISGHIKGGENKPIFLQYVKPNAMVPMQTGTVDDKGNFSFDFDPEMVGFYRIGLHDQDGFFVIASPGEKIRVEAEAGQLYKTFTVTGSEQSEQLKELNRITMRRDSINMVLQMAQSQQNGAMFETAYAQYDLINDKVDRQVKDFVEKYPKSLACLVAIQNMNPDMDFPYYKKVIENLDGVANGNDIYDFFKEQVDKMGVLAVGSPAPEIKLPQPDGVELALSDLKGNYVLVDFWASWCGPCRRENPNVRKVYAKYHDQGFEILGVSLDKTKANWITAIEQDQLTWKHISDLKYWQSSVVPLYQIQSIPLTYLIDKNGIIIAKNLRGSELEEKLAEIFGEK